MTAAIPEQVVCSPDGFVERFDLRLGTGGPLEGARLAVKDNIGVGGKGFAAGHPLFRDRRATATAPAVQMLLQAGATVVGMTSTDAGGFGVTTPGVTNPVDPERIVGGSTGGGAAAVASGKADLAIGTDTGGSVRIPAACTGLFAYKPDFGAVPTEGIWALAPSFDHVGLIAGSGDLLFRAAHAMLGAPQCERVPVRRKEIRIGIEAHPPAEREAWVTEGMDRVRRSLLDVGYALVPVDLPDRRRMLGVHATITLAEAAEIYGDLSEEDIQQLGPAAVPALKAANRLTVGQVAEAWACLATIREQFAGIFSTVDLILTPSLSFLPPRLNQVRIETRAGPIPVVRAMAFETCGFNMYGGPAMSFPAGQSDASRIPFSVQAAAARASGPEHIVILKALLSDLSQVGHGFTPSSVCSRSGSEL